MVIFLILLIFTVGVHHVNSRTSDGQVIRQLYEVHDTLTRILEMYMRHSGQNDTAVIPSSDSHGPDPELLLFTFKHLKSALQSDGFSDESLSCCACTSGNSTVCCPYYSCYNYYGVWWLLGFLLFFGLFFFILVALSSCYDWYWYPSSEPHYHVYYDSKQRQWIKRRMGHPITRRFWSSEPRFPPGGSFLKRLKTK